MKRKISHAGLFIVTLSLVVVISYIPKLSFIIQKDRLLNRVSFKESNIIEVKNNVFKSEMSLLEKFETIIKGDIKNSTVALEMGEILSIYDAKRTSLEQLKRIPFLNMDRYEFKIKDINVIPKLVVDSHDSVRSIVVWIGKAQIGTEEFEFVLDERSQKIVNIECKNSTLDYVDVDGGNLLKEWASYMEFKIVSLEKQPVTSEYKECYSVNFEYNDENLKCQLRIKNKAYKFQLLE